MTKRVKELIEKLTIPEEKKIAKVETVFLLLLSTDCVMPLREEDFLGGNSVVCHHRAACFKLATDQSAITFFLIYY